MRERLRRDPIAGILNTDGHLVVDSFGDNVNRAAAAGYRILGIGQEIQEHLFQLQKFEAQLYAQVGPKVHSIDNHNRVH